jgi:CheY-like chemotaxis protein
LKTSAKNADKRIQMEFDPGPSRTLISSEQSAIAPGGELSGRRVAIIGFERVWAVRFYGIIQGSGAFCRISPNSEFEAEARTCDLVFVYVQSGEDPPKTSHFTKMAAVILVMRASAARRSESAEDYIFYPCTPREILTRAAIALERNPSSSVRSADNPYRVLIVDDDPAIHALLKAAVETDNLKCQCTLVSRESLTIAREWHPDLIVLDVNMPGMSGYQVLSALRASRSNVRTPVLLLTGCDHRSEVIKGFNLGAQDYMVKPFNPVDVAARIRKMVTGPGVLSEP